MLEVKPVDNSEGKNVGKLSEEAEQIINADGSNSEKGFNDHSVKILNGKAAKRPENATMDNE